MSKEYTERIISNIDEKYIDESIRYLQRRKKPMQKVIKWVGTVAACMAGIFVLSVSSLSMATAAGFMPAYDILHALYPSVAARLSPVNVSCQDEGIEMRVEAANIQGSTAEIYISMTDLKENRIDETIDLFDSYSINTSADQIGGCSFVDYDAENKTATFLITVQQMNGEDIEGEKLTFSVSRFLSGKQEIATSLSEIDLQNIPTVTEVLPGKEASARGDRPDVDIAENLLLPNSQQKISIAKGATITAYGFVDGTLHIQAYYEDILRTDNHGSILVIDADGNEMYPANTISFWDDEQKGSYEEYIFGITPASDLNGYTLSGDFVAGASLYEGKWRVSFKITSSR